MDAQKSNHFIFTFIKIYNISSVIKPISKMSSSSIKFSDIIRFMSGGKNSSNNKIKIHPYNCNAPCYDLDENDPHPLRAPRWRYMSMEQLQECREEYKEEESNPIFETSGKRK